VVDDKTFRIVLKEPYGLLLDALAKTSTPLCVMMKAEIAATDPNTQITKHIGSGPFKFVESEYRPGSRVVYERNPDYVPRSEPASGIAGGKRRHARPRHLGHHARRADCRLGADGRRGRLLRSAADRHPAHAVGGAQASRSRSSTSWAMSARCA
jgi:hypothetical protein